MPKTLNMVWSLGLLDRVHVELELETEKLEEMGFGLCTHEEVI